MSSMKTILGYDAQSQFEEEIIAQNETIIELLKSISDTLSHLVNAIVETDGDE